MAKIRMILVVACAFVFCMCQAQRADYESLNKNVGILFSETEKCANLTNNISQILKKLESANQVLNQTTREIQNGNEDLRTKLTTLEATCTCAPTTTSSTTTIQTTTTEPPTTTATEPTTQVQITQFLSSCDYGWKLFNGHCYLVLKYVLKRWDDASAFCKEMNSYLIEITTDEERAFVGGVCNEYLYWTGATERENYGKFVYQHSKQQVPEKYWSRAEPNNAYGQHCAGMYVSDNYNGELIFYDDACSELNSFVCEKP